MPLYVSVSASTESRPLQSAQLAQSAGQFALQFAVQEAVQLLLRSVQEEIAQRQLAPRFSCALDQMVQRPSQTALASSSLECERMKNNLQPRGPPGDRFKFDSRYIRLSSRSERRSET